MVPATYQKYYLCILSTIEQFFPGGSGKRKSLQMIRRSSVIQCNALSIASQYGAWKNEWHIPPSFYWHICKYCMLKVFIVGSQFYRMLFYDLEQGDGSSGNTVCGVGLLIEIVTCCLKVQSHHLHQCWFTTHVVILHPAQGNLFDMHLR